MPRVTLKPKINKRILKEVLNDLDQTRINNEVEIQEIRRELDKRHAFNSERLRHAVIAQKNTWIRDELHEMVDDKELPEFINLVQTDEQTGQKRHIYKRRTRLGAEEYRQNIDYRVAMANKHIRVAREMAAEALARHGVQIELKFEPPVGNGANGGGAVA